MSSKKVQLIGAGPGDVELITVKGLKAIQDADAILYDALVNKELLKECKPSAKLIYVGKRAGAHSATQDDINLAILQAALNYDHVVRLKGGDPFVFGRGHEELVYLKNFDIDVEVIPGLTTSTSLPLLQSVPVTKRGVSESFWVMTGTTSFGKLSNDVRLGIKSSATLVILMGIKKISQIAELLEQEGKNEMPIMIIQNGSMPNQKVLITSGKEVVRDIVDSGIGTPGIIIIGEVVKLHPDFVIEKYMSSWINP